MTSCHLISNRNFAFLCDIDSHRFIDAGRQLIGIFAGKHAHIDNNTGFAVRKSHRGITHFSCLFAKNRTQQTLFRRKLRFALRRNLADKNISCMNLGSVADNTILIKILQSIVTAVRDLTSNFLRPKLCISGLKRLLLYMNGSIHIIAHKIFIEQDRIFVVIAFPCHKADQRILSECDFAP